MNASHLPVRDERTVSVENASYRLGFVLLTYALLIDAIYRSGVRHEEPWDLLGLVVIGAGICTAYQAREKTLVHGWVVKAVLVACGAGLLAAAVAFWFQRWMHG